LRKKTLNPRGTLSNLKPWKPGQSGNPSGRSRKLPITEALEQIGQQIVPTEIRKILRRKLNVEVKPGSTFAQCIALALISKAIVGDVEAIREFTNRVQGKALQQLEIATPENRDVRLHVIYEESEGRRRRAVDK
jgi:hypothetical protein